MTINISLPRNLYEDAKKIVQTQSYSSVSELMRDALRKIVYPELTVNGFTKEFEDQILKIANKSDKDHIVLETKEEIDNYFRNLQLPSRYRVRVKNGKDKIPSKV